MLSERIRPCVRHKAACLRGARRDGFAHALGRVPVRGEGGAELVAVRLVAHRQRQLDLGLADQEVEILAVVLHRDDVGALLRDELEKLDQLAGPVLASMRTTR